MTTTDRDEIVSTIKRWARAFSAGDAETIMSLWDRSYPELIHQAEEFPDPLRGWDEIERYNHAMAKNASGHRDHGVHDLVADVLGDVAWCYLRGSITFDWPGLDKPIAGQARQLFLLRRRPNGWKFIQYHESRETPGLREPLRIAHPEPARMTDPAPQVYVTAPN